MVKTCSDNSVKKIRDALNHLAIALAVLTIMIFLCELRGEGGRKASQDSKNFRFILTFLSLIYLITVPRKICYNQIRLLLTQKGVENLHVLESQKTYET